MTAPTIDLAPSVAATASAVVEAAVPQPQRRPRRVTATRVTRAASIVISIAALAILLRRVDLPAALRTATSEPLLMLAAAVALNAVATWVRAARSQLVLSALGHHVPPWRMAGVQLAGQTLSWVSPAAAGDLVRPYLWRSHDGVPLTPGVVTVVYERIISFGQLGVVGAACIAPFVITGPALGGVAAAGLALLVVPWLVPRLFPLRSSSTAAGRRGWRARIAAALGQLWRLAADGRLTARFTALTLVVVAVSALQIELLALGIGVHLPLWIAAAAFSLSQVIGSASSLPFGLGPADAVLVAMLAHAGAGADGAVAITLLTRLTVTVPLGLAGAATYAWLSRRAPARVAAS